MFKILIDYPDATEEAAVLKMHSRQVDVDERLAAELATVTSPAEIVEHDEAVRRSARGRQADRLHQHARPADARVAADLHGGVAARGAGAGAGRRTLAAFYGRDYAVPDDVVQIALPALRHRAILTAEADVEGHKVDDVLSALVKSVEVPRV